MKADLTIGELASELRLNPKTIRYYEEIGLLPEPTRSNSGYRLYSRDEIERLRLIKRAKLLGLSLAEIKELVEYAIEGHCGALKSRLHALVEAKLGEIDQKIEDLIAFRNDLQRYHKELSKRFESEASQACKVPTSDSCQCMRGVDSFKR